MKKVSGGYILVIEVRHPLEIQVGKLGNMRCEPGQYLYGGSAKNGIASRINRHLKDKKKPYWHIDYLTNHPEILVQEAWCYPDQSKIEHKIAQHNKIQEDGVLRGFGNGDCKAGCFSHLWKVDGKIRAADFSEDYYIVTRAEQYSKS